MRSLAVMKPGHLEIVDVSVPKIDANRVLIKTLACGICNGTDSKILHGTFKNIHTYPALLGHEGIGEVVEVGKDVELFRKGDLVLLPFIEQPDEGYASYWGAFSEYGICGDWTAMAKNGVGPGTDGFWKGYHTQTVLPKGFDPIAGVMIITFREVLSAAIRFGFAANKSLAVFGAGPVGLTFIKFAKLMGMGPIIVFDIQDEKLKEAESAGADFAYNSSRNDPVEMARKVCPQGVDFALDAVGINALINTSMKIIKDGGDICAYGISPTLGMDIDWSEAPYNWNLKFVQFPDKEMEGAAHQQVMNWIDSGALNPNDYISHVFEFDRVKDAFDLVAKKGNFKKIVIRF